MSIQDILLARAGRRTKARKRAALAPLRAAVASATEPSLDGVPFSSRQAEDMARTAGLDWRDFAGVKCSGCAGYVVDDVRRVLEARNA